ncbi:MAG: tetratricopeptide repeat protein [Gammaproteobacteria bacterium]
MTRFSVFGMVMAMLLSATALAADLHIQFEQALSLSKQGEWQQAAELFQQLAKQQPDWPEPKNNLAVALLNLGQLEQARQSLELAVTSQSSFKVAQDNRQKLYDHLAAKAYEKALGNNGNLQPPELQLIDRIQQATVQVVEPVAVTDFTTDKDDMIRQQLDLWSGAWSKADADAYLACYSPRFKSFDQNIDLQQWRYQRRIRLKSSKNVDISLDNIKVFLDQQGNTALVEFIQFYRSAIYNDKVIKQLLLSHENDQWLITSERVIKTL